MPMPAAKAPPPVAPPGASEATGGQDKASDSATGPSSAHLSEWLAALNLPERATSAASADAKFDDLAPAAANASAIAATRDDAKSPPGVWPGAAGSDDPAGSAITAQDIAPAAAKPSELIALVTSADRPPRQSETLVERDPTPGLLGGAAGAVPRGFDPGTLAPITLSAPVYSAEFAQALGAQVSLLARDGVQQAELHLNPADMGPISVQIEVQGQQARVDFSADAAATREVIERGLPELASALREQGLTLSGGGVFQDSAQRQQTRDQATATGARRASSRAAAAPIRLVAAQPPQGRLDLYA
jgi:flagellar hook-length control protein FliK